MFKPDIKRMFVELNQKHFNGEIPNIPVKWNNRMTTTAGLFRFRRSMSNLTPVEINLSNKLFKSLNYDMAKIQRTLIHEMVHAYLCHKYNEKGHTRRFQRMMTDITGERKNHRCHDYNVEGLKRRKQRKVKCECTLCGYTYNMTRLPKHANKTIYTHRGCGGLVKFSRISVTD